jgi:O-antigen chain-terminating methyltransferase
MNLESRSPAGQLTVSQLLEKVRARIDAKRAQGEYPEDKVRNLPRSYQDLDRAIREHLDRLNALCDPTEPHPIVSHRPIIGPLIVRLKKTLRWAGRPAANLFLARQKEFDAHTVRLLNPTLIILRDLLLRFEELATLYFAVHERHGAVWEDYIDLRKRLDRLDVRVESLSSPVRELRIETRAVEDAGWDGKAYVDFENRHRGTREEILARQRVHLDDLRAGGDPVVDLGCGRGEFLELLAEAGMEGEGVDSNPAMVEECASRGFRATRADALSYLGEREKGSLGGVFSAQLIEHLPFASVADLVSRAHRALRPGGVLVIETLNPACLSVFSGAFYLDPTHIRPLHPEAMRFLFESLGFRDVRVRFLSPVPEEAKLRSIDFFHRLERFEDAFLDVLNDNIARLNELLYGYQEYAVIGRQGTAG